MFMTIAPAGCFVLLHSAVSAWTYLLQHERGPIARHLVRLGWLQPPPRLGLDQAAPLQLYPQVRRCGRLPLSRLHAGARRRSDLSGVPPDFPAPHCAGRRRQRGNHDGAGAPASVSKSCQFSAPDYLTATFAMSECVLTKLVTKTPT